MTQARANGANLWVNGREIVRYRPGEADRDRLLPTLVSQPALLGMLVKEASRFNGFSCEMGTVVRDLLWEGRECVGAIIDGGNGSRREVRANLVIGADGRGSHIYKRSRLPAKQVIDQGFDVFWAQLPVAPSLASGQARAWVGGGGLTLAFGTHGGDMQLGTVIEKGGFGDIRAAGLDHWLDDVCRRVDPGFAKELRALGEVSSYSVLNVQMDRAEKWWRPGLLFLGDAAHTMSPVGAQGINMAIRDAVVAANHLVPAFAHGLREPLRPNLSYASLKFQEEREPEIVACQKLQNLPPRIFRGQSLSARLLLFLAPLLAMLWPVRFQVRRNFEQFSQGFVPVALQV